MVSTNSGGHAAAAAGADVDMQQANHLYSSQKAHQTAASPDSRPCSSAACSSAPGSQQTLHSSQQDHLAAGMATCSFGGSDDVESDDMVEDDGYMSDADSGDSDLTARITGLEVRLARRSAEVEMLKAAVAACQADRRTPSPPTTPQAPHRPVAHRAAPPDPMPRFLSADSAGQFVVSLDGRVVLSSGPYAGKPLSQVAQYDRQYLQTYLWAAPPPPQQPPNQSQLLAALALRNTLPVRCR